MNFAIPTTYGPASPVFLHPGGVGPEAGMSTARRVSEEKSGVLLAEGRPQKQRAERDPKPAAKVTALATRHAQLHESLRCVATGAAAPAELLAASEGILRRCFPEAEVLVLGLAGNGEPAPQETQEGHPVPEPLWPLAASVLLSGQPLLLPDTRDSAGPEAAGLAAAGILSAAAVPCAGPEGTLAAVGIGRRAGQALANVEVTLLSGVAAHLGTALYAAAQRATFKESYQALKETQGQRVRTERLAAVGQMAAGVAHGFNNLLASIMVRAELLRQALINPEWIAHVEVIERASHDGARTVRRLQEFTRQETPRDFRPFDLNAAVRDSLEITKSRWQDDAHLSGISIEVAAELGEIAPALGDGSEIREVLTNLIVNAVDAMPKGGRLRLTTRWIPLEQRVEAAVADTGTGMSDEVRAQIFDPFFTTKGPKGSGLGLSVSYGIVKRHGGSIQVQTAPGAGTTFTLSLPAAADALAQARGKEPPEEAAAALQGPLRILVIDDEEPFRVSLYTALHREGHFVAVAASGEEGLKLFGISTFDVVLTDLGMPGMGGWQVAQAVKEMRPGTPVVLITGWGATLTEADRQRPEVEAVLAKPITSKAILQVLACLPLGGQRNGGTAQKRRRVAGRAA